MVEQHRSVSSRIGEHAAHGYDPELALLRRRYARELELAFDKSFAALAMEQRLLLQQHHIDGLSIDRLAKLYGIHRATAARRVAAVREALLASVRATLVSQLGIGEETFESIVRLVQSEMDINLEHHAACWPRIGAE